MQSLKLVWSIASKGFEGHLVKVASTTYERDAFGRVVSSTSGTTTTRQAASLGSRTAPGSPTPTPGQKRLSAMLAVLLLIVGWRSRRLGQEK